MGKREVGGGGESMIRERGIGICPVLVLFGDKERKA